MFVCATCSRSFKTKSTLKRHGRVVHALEEATANATTGSFVCFRCDQSFISVAAIEKHFRIAHAFTPITNAIQFTAEESFLEWKERIEHPSLPAAPGSFAPSYVVYRGARHKADGSLTKYWTCSLSSLYAVKRSAGCPEAAKYYCPSRITSTCYAADGRIEVSYVSTHIPHSRFNNPQAAAMRADIKAALTQLTDVVDYVEDGDCVARLSAQLNRLLVEFAPQLAYIRDCKQQERENFQLATFFDAASPTVTPTLAHAGDESHLNISREKISTENLEAFIDMEEEDEEEAKDEDCPANATFQPLFLGRLFSEQPSPVSNASLSPPSNSTTLSPSNDGATTSTAALDDGEIALEDFMEICGLDAYFELIPNAEYTPLNAPTRRHP